MSTYTLRLDEPGTGVRLAVKDIIDIEGLPTTVGCRAVSKAAAPADRDAKCLVAPRRAGARYVGKTNLHELALGVTGVNPWFGTPVNPLDPTRVPGGSSSGSAVAVANCEADVALGTDTGGSVRIPSACCGTAGLKTTWGRIPTEGVWPLAPSFDTVGPMARDVDGLILGMSLLEPGFSPDSSPPRRIGRIRVDCDPAIGDALDRALRLPDWEIVDIHLPELDEVNAACGLLLVAEAWATDGKLAEEHPNEIGQDVVDRLRLGREIDESATRAALEGREAWEATLLRLFDEVELIALPTLTIVPPTLEEGENLLMARCTLPANLGGVPALALPVPSSDPLPASLQLMGPAGAEERLLAAGRVVEAALA